MIGDDVAEYFQQTVFDRAKPFAPQTQEGRVHGYQVFYDLTARLLPSPISS